MPKPTLMDLQCAQCPSRSVCMGRCGRMHKEFTKKHINEYCTLNQHMFQLFQDHLEDLTIAYRAHPNYYQTLNSPILEFTEFTP